MFKKAVLFLIAFSFGMSGHPRGIGLVLSGGGAKGLAHIGVIRALEENGIPIDYITGTSMGAIIGALYASGYSPDEMEFIILSDEFSSWSTGRIPVSYSSYHRERHFNASMLSFEFERYDSITIPVFPTNLIPTHSMDLGLLEVFAQAGAKSRYDFDNLFIPFRCVASDVYNNSSLVIKRGDLSEAVRASITYPFYFNPIKIDGILLFDGGIHNNFPFDVMVEEFGPDLVIGSKTSSNPPPPTPGNLRLQLHSLITAKTDYDIEKIGGILIESDIREIGTFDFRHLKRIIESGYTAALLKMEEIKSRIDDRITVEEIAERRKNYRDSLPPLIFENIIVSGSTGHQIDYVTRSIRQQEKYFTIDRLRAEYYGLVSNDKVNSIYPRAVFNQTTGLFDLHLDLSSQARLETSLGGNISSGSLNQGFAGIEYKALGRNAYNLEGNIYFGRLYNSAMARGKIELPGSLPFFCDVAFTFNRLDYFTSNNGPFFDDVRPSYLIKNDVNLRVNAGTPVGMRSIAKFGYAIGRVADRYYQTENFMRSDTSDRTNFDLSALNLTYEHRTLDHKQFATRGRKAKIDLHFVRGKETFSPGSISALGSYSNNNHMYFRAGGQFTGFYPVNSFLTLGVSGELVLSTQSLFNNYTASLLNSPAYQPFPHSAALFLDNYRAHSFAAAGLVPIFRLNNSMHLRIEANVFQPYKKIGRDDLNRPFLMAPLKHRHFMGSAALVYHTPVGPASISLNYYEKNGQSFYVIFNFGYLLFNRMTL